MTSKGPISPSDRESARHCAQRRLRVVRDHESSRRQRVARRIREMSYGERVDVVLAARAARQTPERRNHLFAPARVQPAGDDERESHRAGAAWRSAALSTRERSASDDVPTQRLFETLANGYSFRAEIATRQHPEARRRTHRRRRPAT